MTVSTTIIKNSYSGDGSTTAFAYQFKISADADMQVIIRSSTGAETVKTLTTHYTVSGAGTASGGNVTFESGHVPTATETVILRRVTTRTQGLDLVENDPFTADSVEGAFDKNLSIGQEIQEEVDRSIKLSRTNTMTSTEFTLGATDRANKILAFDSSGEISVTQELGTFKGNSPTTTTAAFVQRDIVKATTTAQLNNIYICVADSAIGDTLTDTDHFALLVDAVSAATSATNAATSATTATTKASEAATSATNAATSESNASTSASTASTKASEASTSESNAGTSETNAASSATSAASSATTATTKASEASTSASNAASSATAAASSATTATTKASEAATSATNAATSASTATTKASEAATSATNSASSATASASSATAAATSATEAAASADAFDDTYLGSKSSDPTADNDGDALNAGDLYFNTTTSQLKYYTGSAWVAIAPGITSVVEDTTPQLGGNLASNGNDIVFADSDKAIFGAGSDLQIFHDGSNSFIQDSGTGDIIIYGTGEDLAKFKDDGSVELYHNNVKKIETTAAGVDVAGTIGATGVITANAGVVVDNITIDGTEIDLSSGDLTLDSAGDIILDADGADILFKDNGTLIGKIANNDNSNFRMDCSVQDKDFILGGNDGGTIISAMVLDMSAAGAATFNNDVTAFSDERLKKDIETIPNALHKVCQMRGVTFERIDDEGHKSMGVIAQEVEKIIPEVVREDKSEDKIKSVAYGNMVGLLIEAIKELKTEVEELKRGN